MLLSPRGSSVFRSRFMKELTSGLGREQTRNWFPADSFPVDRFQNTLSAEKRWLGFAVTPLFLFGVSNKYWIEVLDWRLIISLVFIFFNGSWIVSFRWNFNLVTFCPSPIWIFRRCPSGRAAQVDQFPKESWMPIWRHRWGGKNQGVMSYDSYELWCIIMRCFEPYLKFHQQWSGWKKIWNILMDLKPWKLRIQISPRSKS